MGPHYPYKVKARWRYAGDDEWAAFGRLVVLLGLLALLVTCTIR